MLYLVDSINERYYVEDSETLVIKSYIFDDLRSELKNGLKLENITYDDLELARKRCLVISRNNSEDKSEIEGIFMNYGNTSGVFNWAERRVFGRDYFIYYSFSKNLARFFINNKFYNIDTMMTTLYINNECTVYQGLIMYFGYIEERNKIVIATRNEYIEFTGNGAVKKDSRGRIMDEICQGTDMTMSQLYRKMVL